MKRHDSSPEMGLRRPGFALVCDPAGKIISIVSDFAGLPTEVTVGRLFPSIVAGRSAGDAFDFLDEVASKGSAFDRALAMKDDRDPEWFRFSGSQVDGLLVILASQVEADALVVAMSELNNELVNSQRELARTNAELARLSEERMVLLRELKHRDKNTFNMIASLINISASEGDSPEASKVLGELDDRVRAVANLYSLLNDSESFTELRLDEYCAKIAAGMLAGRPGLALVTDLDPVSIPISLASPIGLILTEFLTNTLKYAFPEGRQGRVRVTLKVSQSGGMLTVADDGVGIPPDFDSTKGGGLGMGIMRGLAEQIGGGIAITGDGGGTRGELAFPLSKPR